MTQQKLHIRKGDAVVVISGSQKGKKGEVLKILREDRRAVVKGVNVVKRHTKASGTNPGGIVEKEMSIHVSMLFLNENMCLRTHRASFFLIYY